MSYLDYLDHHADCPWLPHEDQKGVCDRCGTALTGRRTRWCSDACMYEWRQQHDWGAARNAAVKRDGHKCVKCGAAEYHGWREPEKTVRLEVNHIVPREGRGYGFGCHNHLDNLETLCVPCHRAVTNAQAAARRERRNPAPRAEPMLDLDLAGDS